MEIEIEIFSGKPNPVWMLDSASEQELVKKLENLLPAKALSVPGLGYRGFIIRGLPGAKAPAQEVRVGAGVVSIGSEHFEDNHGLEIWLMNNAAQHGYAKLLPPLESVTTKPRR